MPMFGPEELRAAVMRKLSEGGTQEPDPNAAPLKAQTSIGVAPYAALAGGSIADAASTIAALKRPGASEGNPLLGGGPAELLAVKGAGTAAVLLAMRELVKRGHPTAAKVLGYAGGAGFGAAAANNMRQGQ